MERIVVTNTATSYLAQLLEDGYISSTEVVDLTAVSYRRLDYWYMSGVFGKPVPCGSGQRRMWHKCLIPVISLLGEISYEFGHYNNTSVVMLKRIYEDYERGWIQFSPNTRLEWKFQ